MKLIKYKLKSAPFGTRYKILQNKRTAVQFYGLSEFKTIEDISSAIIGKLKCSPKWWSKQEPKNGNIRENKRSYKVLAEFKTIEDFKNLFPEYFI